MAAGGETSLHELGSGVGGTVNPGYGKQTAPENVAPDRCKATLKQAWPEDTTPSPEFEGRIGYQGHLGRSVGATRANYQRGSGRDIRRRAAMLAVIRLAVWRLRTLEPQR